MATAANLEPYSGGVQKVETCHKIISCRVQELKRRNEISANERLIEWKTEFSNWKTMCLHHVKRYLTRYESLQKACYNPFQTHAKAFSGK